MATLVVLVLAGILAGCGKSEGTTGAEAQSTTTAGTGPESSATVPEPLDQLRILHPQTLAFSAPFDLIDPEGELGAVASKVSSGTWATPDVVRTALVNGDVEVAAVPTYVGANLYNRDVDVRLTAVVVWGLLWLIGPDGQPGDWESLRGQTVMVPFRNDMPDLIFRYLAEANGMKPGEDFTIEYYAQPPEIVGRLLQGSGTWAVLPEHVATIVLNQAGANGRKLDRVMDLQSEWADATGLSPRIPQAGVVMPGRLVDDRPDVVGAVLTELERTVDLVNAAQPSTLQRLSEVSGLPPETVKEIIPRMNLEVVSGAEARDELERFFEELASRSPEIIGGSLPEAGFYAADPR